MSYGWYYSRPKKAKKKSTPGEKRPRMKFGQTWWGGEWLNALTHIDDENRLPRGRAYAGNGSVKDIVISGNEIAAKVKGSMPSPYKIKVEIPLLTDAQKELLVNEILNNPLILSRLLNREVPEELNRLALDHNIRIFPASWKDFGMKCSCPDWAVPCKHLAAVIYLIANEIDANPFILFKLRGFDLIGSLKGHHASIGEHEEEKIPELAGFLVEKLPGQIAEPDFSTANLPDFTVIEDQTGKVLALLPSSPLFYPKDFKPILQSAYKHIASAATRKSSYLKPALNEVVRRLDTFDRVMIFLNEDLSVEDVTLIGTYKNKNREYSVNLDEFNAMLDAVDPAILENSIPALRGIALHRQFALAIAEHGAFLPQLLLNCENNYLIRYVPADNDRQILELCIKMKGYAIPGIIRIKNTVGKSGGQYLDFNADEISRMLLSVFLGNLAKTLQFDKKFAGNGNDAISNLFFHQMPHGFRGLTEKQIPNTIQLWLKRLHLAASKWQPVIQIGDKQGVFTLDVLVLNTEEVNEPPVHFTRMISEKKHQSASLDLLRNLSALTGFLPDLAFYLQSSGKNPMRFDSLQFVEVFQRILPTLRMFGIGILMPKALEKLLVPRPSLRLKSQFAGKELSFLGLDEMLGFDYQVAIGDRVMPVEDFMKLVKGLSGIVKIKDQYVLLNDGEMDKILNQASLPATMSSNQLLRTALAGEFEGATISLDPQVIKLIKKLTSPEKIALPKGINALLRPYQTAGFQWMAQQSKIGFGSLIADDMGLGKTLQVIALIQKFKLEGLLEKDKALVVVPTTLLTNWLKEIEKFAPSLRAAVYHGAGRKLDLADTDILLTTYGMVRSDLKTLKSKNWHVLVIDEAQNIKNTATDQTKAVKSIKSAVRIAMSGTPVENRLSEYWSIMDFVFPGYLGPAKAFTDEFATPIQVYHDRERAALFRKITAPFILRRLKTDKTIISDLPEKIENNRYCSLTGEQAGLYQNVLDLALNSIEGADGIQRRGLVLKMITALKQICNHPGNYLKKGKPDPAISGKSQALMELLENIHDAGEKTLIFTQYREMGDILVPMIEEQFGFTPLFLHGGTSRKHRDEFVEDFQNKHNRWIFILSLKAGGTGLNLTAANHVIHHDFWWNPAVEAQATDRAYRIGQHKNVMVNRLLTRGTFEEKIDEMLQNKKELANLTVASGEQWIGDLSNTELKEIFRLA